MENTTNTQERRLVTMEDWAKAGDFSKCAKPGDLVTDEIADEMLNVLPPAFYTASMIQMGEPYEHRFDPETGRWRALYLTLARFEADNGAWTFCGYCFRGKRRPPEDRKEKTA